MIGALASLALFVCAQDAGWNQFGRLVGAWDIHQEVLTDGAWTAVSDATWEFFPAFDGEAVRDEWIQPPRHVPVPSGERRQLGTTIRFYDPENDRWRVVWASSDSDKATVYEAQQQEDESMQMIGRDPERGLMQRITYFEIKQDSWRWKMAFSKDGENWLEVARIHAVRKEVEP